MCGIAGFVDYNNNATIETITKMVESINYRGPDNLGAELFNCNAATIGLGQSRLSIIDLSDLGNQPMSYENFQIVFNGEIYNYKELKAELEMLGYVFKTNSDTEVILKATKEWGDEAVHRFIGMFVYCIYDNNKNQLSITRDRAGVKPVYYYFEDKFFLFGSELKAIVANPCFKKEIEGTVLPQFLQYGYIPAPHSIYKNCYKLMPGHRIVLDIDKEKINIEQYWNSIDFYTNNKLDITYSEAKDKVKELLTSSCNYRMVADVPVGVFLSGGYDSTAVAAIIQSQQLKKINTYTIGFESKNNEADYAKSIAFHIGTNHTELYCSLNDIKDIIPQLPYIYDEPFGDVSAIPTILVSQLAKKDVKVAISADGGDELFCGYIAYNKVLKYNKQLNQIPNVLKSALSSASTAIPKFQVAGIQKQHHFDSFLKSLNSNQNLQVRNLFQLMNEKPKTYIDQFFNINSSIISPFKIKTDNINSSSEIPMAIDYSCYLPNDILTKVDRATMSVSIEGREPLLDHRLFEFVAQLPFEFKFAKNINKKILKDIVHDYVPYSLMNRPKSGFSFPIDELLRGELSFLTNYYLNENSLNWSGLLNVQFASTQVKMFKENKMFYSHIIWRLLMFQMWYEKWMK